MVVSVRPVRAVLFDMTGTLHSQVQLGHAVSLNCAHMAESVGGVSAGDLLTAMRAAVGREMVRYVEKPFYLMEEIYRDAYPAALSQMGASFTDDQIGGFIEHFRQTAAASVSPQEGAVEVLSELRTAGFRTGIVSVNDRRDLELLVEGCGFADLFDFILSSEEARSCKPDAGIFRQALAICGRSADETVFVGDTPRMDIRGANRAGMRSVLTTQETGFAPTLVSDSADDVPDFTISHLGELLAVVFGDSVRT